MASLSLRPARLAASRALLGSRGGRGGWLLLALLLVIGCRPGVSYLRRYERIRPARYALLLPRGREQLPCVSRFAEHKHRLGFSVDIIAFEPSGSPAERLGAARRLLREREAPEGGPAYLLILATHEELPMGPWSLPEESEEILSDIPLIAPCEALPPATLGEDHWRAAASAPDRWIVGRLPCDHAETIEAVLATGVRFESAGTPGPPAALLGAERFAVWADSALVMSHARDALRQAGWKGELWSEDPPRDHPTGTERRRVELPLPTSEGPTPEGATRSARGPSTYTPQVSTDFVARWAEMSPRVVYAIAHSSFFRGGVGDDLVDFPSLQALDLEPKAPVKKPTSPAVFITTGCSTGYPGDAAVAELFRRGWIAAFAGSTVNNGPSPLLPAVRAEVNIAYFLAHGLPLGLAVQATKEAYASESLRAPGHWFFPSIRRQQRRNLLSYVIYGDPSLTARPRPAEPVR